MTSNLLIRRQSSKSHGALQEKKDHEDIFESVPQINGKEKTDEDDEDDADDDDDEGEELPQDVYSLVYSENRSIDSEVILFVITVCVLQLLVVIFIFNDLLNYQDGKPWPNPPADVTWFMKVSQYLAILLAVATQDDLTESIKTIMIVLFGPISHSNENKGNTMILVISCIAKMVVGFLTLFGSLVIVIQSEHAIDLFANFAGMFFVSSVDNYAFSLADAGFFSKHMRKRANDVKLARFPKKTKNSHHIHQITVLAVLASMLGVNTWITYRQSTGDFFSHDLTIFLTDEVHQLYPLVNSRYLWNGKRKGGRPIYIRDQCDMGCDLCCYSIMYCVKSQAWTLSETPESDPCSDYLLTSDRTDTFDVLSIPPSQWKVFDIKNSVEVFSSAVRVINSECTTDMDCNFAGSCNPETNHCVCNPKRFGFQCQASTPCESLEIDISKEDFALYANNFQFLRDETTNEIITTYNGRPIYYHKVFHYYQLLLYYGSRWVISNTFINTYFHEIDREHRISDLYQYFDQFTPRSWWDFLSLDYISEETDSFEPVKLHWNQWTFSSPQHRVFQETSLLGLESVNTVILCKTCNSETNEVCSFNGHCQDDVCVCDEGYHGVNCHLPLVSGKYSLLLDHGDALPCGACLNKNFRLSNCQDVLPESKISFDNNTKTIAIDMNSTHLLVYVVENEVLDCENAELIHTVHRRPDGKLVKYEDVFEITATSATRGYSSNYCSDRFSLSKNICSFLLFSSYSKENIVERMFFHIDVDIAGQIQR